MTTTTEIPMYPVSETKKDLERHLAKHHQYRPWSLNSKATKEQLVRWHDSIHVDAEMGTEMERSRGLGHFRGEELHVHGTPTVEETAPDDEFAPLQLDKPLSGPEAAGLKVIIDNDFDTLEADLRAMATDAKRERLAEIEADWSAKDDRPAHYRELRDALITKVRTEAQRMVDRAGKDGVLLNCDVQVNGSPPQLVGKSDALKTAAAEVDRDLNRALQTLQRQRLSAHRVVALARITPEAQVVLNNIPSAKTLMVQAATERPSISR